MMSELSTPSRVPFRNLTLNLTPSNRSLSVTPKTSPGPALLHAIYLSNSKKIKSPLHLSKNIDKENTTKIVIIDPNNHNVPYFRNLLSTETERLTCLCAKWGSESLETEITNFFEQHEKTEELTDLVLGEVRSVVGQARLIMEQRFKQFRGLVDNCEFNTSEKTITCEDLQGFWDMVYFQVEDVDTKFDQLLKQQQNNWKPVERSVKVDKSTAIKNRKSLKKSAVKPSAALVAKRQEMVRQRLEARKRLQAAKAAIEKSSGTPQKAAMVTFDAGFFKIESPVKFAESAPPVICGSSSDRKQFSVPENRKLKPEVWEKSSKKLNFDINATAENSTLSMKREVKEGEDWPNNLPTSPDTKCNNNSSAGKLNSDFAFVSVEVQTSLFKSQDVSCQTEFEVVQKTPAVMLNVATQAVNQNDKESNSNEEPIEKIVTRLLLPETQAVTEEDTVDPIAYKEHYFRLLAKVKILEAELNAVHDMFEEISTTKQKMQNTSNILSKWHQKLQLKKDSIKREQAETKSNDELLKQQLSEANKKILQLDDTVMETNSKNDLLSHKNEELSSAVSNLQSENERLKLLNDEIHVTMEELQNVKIENENEIFQMQSEMSSLNTQLSDERELSENMRQVIDQSELAFENMTNDIEFHLTTISTLTGENQSLTKQVQMLKEKNHDLTERIETLSYVEDEFKSLEEQFAEQEQKLCSTTNDANDLRNKLDEKTKKCNQTEQMLSQTQKTLEETNNESELAKAHNTVQMREQTEAIGYSELRMKHVYKMMTALNNRLIGLLGKDTEDSNSTSSKVDAELVDDFSLSSLTERSEQMMQCVINTCAEVQLHYKDTINNLNIQLEVTHQKVKELKAEVREKKEDDNECIGMLRRRVQEVMKERDEKEGLLEKYIHDSSSNSKLFSAQDFKPSTPLDKFVLGSASRPQLNSFFTPRQNRRKRRSSSVSDLRSIHW